MRLSAICILLGISLSLFSQQDMIVTKRDTVFGKITGITPEKILVKVVRNNKSASSFIERSNVVDYKFGIIEELKEKFDETAVYTIKTIDKSEFIGSIEHIYHDSIAFKTKYLGKVNIKAEHIKTISGGNYYVSSSGDTWFPNPNATRYYFGPSAYNLEKGEGYYQNVYAIINMANVGITNYFSIGAGFEFISTFSGSPTFFITPKFGFPIGEKFGVSTGIIAGIIAGGEASAGIMYGVGTYGTKEHNFTAGLGYGFLDGELSNSPILTFSGMTRVGRKIALVSENWFIPTDNKYYGIISYGIRLFGTKQSFDIALINNGDIAEMIAVGIPYIDYVIKF